LKVGRDGKQTEDIFKKKRGKKIEVSHWRGKRRKVNLIKEKKKLKA